MIFSWCFEIIWQALAEYFNPVFLLTYAYYSKNMLGSQDSLAGTVQILFFFDFFCLFLWVVSMVEISIKQVVGCRVVSFAAEI
jgi:hypothetical protein